MLVQSFTLGNTLSISSWEIPYFRSLCHFTFF